MQRNFTDKTEIVLGYGGYVNKKGFVALSFWDNHFKQLSTSKDKPILVPADAKGQKFRIMSSKVLEAQFEAQKTAEAEKLQTENLAKAETFLKTNATADGVVVVNDKLQYKVLTDADGATPTVDDTVTLNYELSTLDGKVLDSSYQRQSPSQIPLTQVIEGFKDVVSQMKVGQTVIAWIHPDLGYGVDGNTSVEPNTLLMFKIGLISIDTEELAAQAAETSAN